MQQHIAPIQCKPWTLNGLPDRLIVGHYEDAYGAAVRTLNAVRDRLARLDLAAAPAYEIRELKREELAAAGAVALHELYFGSLGGDGGVSFTGSGAGTKIATPLSAALEQQFGGVATWRRQFVSLAQALGGRSGWVLLGYSRRDGRLHNQIAFDDSQAMLDAAPLLALDMYEHAYHLEFGANAVAYVEAFMRNIDWTAVAGRFIEAAADRSLPRCEPPGETVPAMCVEELAERVASGERIQVIDARPQFHFSRASDMMKGAVYRNPELVEKWANDLSSDAPVAVYCSYGFNVGCAVTAVLRERGFDARYVRGGLSAWYASGGERTHRSQEQA